MQLSFPMRGLSAAVLLECLLSKPVESEGGDGAVEIQSAEAPSSGSSTRR